MVRLVDVVVLFLFLYTLQHAVLPFLHKDQLIGAHGCLPENPFFANGVARKQNQGGRTTMIRCCCRFRLTGALVAVVLVTLTQRQQILHLPRNGLDRRLLGHKIVPGVGVRGVQKDHIHAALEGGVAEPRVGLHLFVVAHVSRVEQRASVGPLKQDNRRTRAVIGVVKGDFDQIVLIVIVVERS